MRGPLAIGLAAIVVLLAVFIVIRLILARRRPAAKAPPVLEVDVAALGDAGPPPSGPALECYNVPVRLAALVVAPAGRNLLPAGDKLADLLDRIVPGMSSVLAAHQPLIRRWPPQLSPRGFASMFFANARLPGDRGKGTPWCAVAGRVEGAEQGIMVGMVLRAATANSLGEVPIERMQQWLDVLRVRL